jgi:hypothetical protein
VAKTHYGATRMPLFRRRKIVYFWGDLAVFSSNSPFMQEKFRLVNIMILLFSRAINGVFLLRGWHYSFVPLSWGAQGAI